MPLNKRRLNCVRVSARELIATCDVRLKIGQGFQALSASVESRLQHADLEELPRLFTTSSVSKHLAGIGRKDDAETRRDFPTLQAGQRVAGRLSSGFTAVASLCQEISSLARLLEGSFSADRRQLQARCGHECQQTGRVLVCQEQFEALRCKAPTLRVSSVLLLCTRSLGPRLLSPGEVEAQLDVLSASGVQNAVKARADRFGHEKRTAWCSARGSPASSSGPSTSAECAAAV